MSATAKNLQAINIQRAFERMDRSPTPCPVCGAGPFRGRFGMMCHRGRVHGL